MDPYQYYSEITKENIGLAKETTISIMAGIDQELYRELSYNASCQNFNSNTTESLDEDHSGKSGFDISMELMEMGFDHPSFTDLKDQQEETDAFMKRAVEIEEGIVQCPNSKCRSWRTMSVEKQLRSADESTSLLSTCLDCKRRWRVG
ncbi:MAG: hypothetical protein JKX76_01740 [Colwellia sp.]|nr:hypothetical protein [Colwellia sp.]